MIAILSWVLVIVLAWAALFAALLPTSLLFVEVVMERFVGPLLDWSLDADGAVGICLRAPVAITAILLAVTSWAIVMIGAIFLCEVPVFMLGHWILK